MKNTCANWCCRTARRNFPFTGGKGLGLATLSSTAIGSLLKEVEAAPEAWRI